MSFSITENKRAGKAINQRTSAPVGRRMMHTCSGNSHLYPIAIKPSPPKQVRHMSTLYHWKHVTAGGSPPKYRIAGKAANHRKYARIGCRMMHACSCPPRYPLTTKPFPPRVSCQFSAFHTLMWFMQPDKC